MIMCLTFLHRYSCGHSKRDQAACAASKNQPCEGISTRVVIHDETCIPCIQSYVSTRLKRPVANHETGDLCQQLSYLVGEHLHETPLRISPASTLLIRETTWAWSACVHYRTSILIIEGAQAIASKSRVLHMEPTSSASGLFAPP